MGQVYQSGNAFVYQLVDGTGAAIQMENIAVTEYVVSVDQNGKPDFYSISTRTNSDGRFGDFVGKAYYGLVPTFGSGMTSVTTTQTFNAMLPDGRLMGLTTVSNQQSISLGSFTESCVTPISQ